LGILPFAPVLAANGAAVLTPAYQNIDVGQVTTVTLRVENVESLYGYQAAIVFNPAVLEVIDADANKPGIQAGLGSFLQPDFVQQNSADNSVGAIICVVAQLAPTGAVSGSGDLFTVTFRGKAQGLSGIQFTDLKLARADGMEISVSRQDAQVAVGDLTQPTATPTATATVTPTPTTTSTAPTATPTATPTSTPAPGQTVIYVVRTGDTLYSIARRFGVTVTAIAQLNGIANTRYIQVGQRLIIPRGPNVTPVPATPQPNPTVYVVRPGDTLYSIARRYGTTVEAIALTNKIANPSLIYVGQKLTIPGNYTTPMPPSGQVHIVQPGETLYSIARRYGTTFWAIAMANNLTNPNVIYAGQRLIIP
jgi:LysM repeat protein